MKFGCRIVQETTNNENAFRIRLMFWDVHVWKFYFRIYINKKILKYAPYIPEVK